MDTLELLKSLHTFVHLIFIMLRYNFFATRFFKFRISLKNANKIVIKIAKIIARLETFYNK